MIDDTIHKQDYDTLERLLRGLRNRHFFAFDLVLFCVTPILALWMLTDGLDDLSQYAGALALYAAIAIVIRMLVFIPFGLYNRYWRYASIDELAQIVLAVATAMIFNLLVYFGTLSFFGFLSGQLPRSMPLLDAFLVLLGVGGVRYSVRLVEREHRRGRNQRNDMKRVVVLGAGSAGATIVREMQTNHRLGLEPVAFLDDDTHKQGTHIFGLPVAGDRHRLRSVVNKYHVQQAIITMPTASGKTIRELTALCREANLPVKTIPGFLELLDDRISLNQLRPIQIEDLLRREPVATDISQVTELLKGKRVIVTGAGGSIGNELCRQIARSDPAMLILLGHGENSLFYMTKELYQTYPRLPMQTVVADIRDADRVRHVFERFQPQIVFHAAAHKHVPLMENNAEEAITNNVLGTRNLVQVASESHVDQFVMISTDKAVNPTSVMGTTKRVAELIVQQSAARIGRCFVVVRFGNVLGSRGSVVPVFKQQIARGGPVTVTHPEVQRYFMTIPEAVQLVLQAATLGKGGEIFVLDMGKPIKIIDMARDLIRLSGLEEGKDIHIVFTGLRPGEKLVEELFLENDHYTRTQHEKIFIMRNGANQISDFRIKNPEFQAKVDALIAAAQKGDADEIRPLLQQIVPEYRPSVFTVKAMSQKTAPALVMAVATAGVPAYEYGGKDRRQAERRKIDVGPPRDIPERRVGDRRGSGNQDTKASGRNQQMPLLKPVYESS